MAFDPAAYRKSLSARRDNLISKYGDKLGSLLEDFSVVKETKKFSKDDARLVKVSEITDLVKRELRKYLEGSRSLQVAADNIKLLTADLRSL